MTAQEFLRAVWPDEGPYCIAIPGEVGYKHYVRDTLRAAMAVVDKHKADHNIFFCVHSLKDAQGVWDPQKVNYKDNSLGAYKKRDQRNMRAARCFFFDLDVDEADNKKFASQREALTSLKVFCDKAQLPKPMVTSSGGGLHVYWLLTDELESVEWQGHATKLRALAKHFGLKFDPARTTDSASVLRVVGTFNQKNGQKRPVQVYLDGVRTPTGEFLKLLDDALVRAGVSVKETPRYAKDAIHNPFGDNVSQNVSGSPPPALLAVLKACKQMQEIVRTKGDVAEPIWHKTLNILRFVENGRAIAHKWSSGSPQYTKEKTDEYLDKLEAVTLDGKKLGPTLCATLVDTGCNPSLCEGCAFASKNSSPIHAARFTDEAAPPKIEITPPGEAQEQIVELPPPAVPFKRLKTGIYIATENDKGDPLMQLIYENDLYPVRRMQNKQSGKEQQVWKVVLPIEGEREITIDAEALYDRSKFTITLSNHGVYIKLATIPYMQEYMVSYIKELQRLAEADRQLTHLGWGDDRKCFILRNKMLMSDGTVRPTTLSVSADRASAAMTKKGTLEKQLELLKFYEHDDYDLQRLAVLVGIAAPMFHATGQFGSIVAASGIRGSSKSTALYTAASLWGHPTLFPINGTSRGATANFRMERLATLANIPIFIDEISEMDPQEAQAVAFSVSQPNALKGRLEGNGTEKAMTEAVKSTLMLCTANKSLHATLAMNANVGDAASMRVFELHMHPMSVHKKWEAEAYLRDLHENYGHVAEIVLMHMMKDRSYEQRIQKLSQQVDSATYLKSGERFWGQDTASLVVAAQVCRELGLFDYKPERLLDRCINEIIPYQRGVIKEEYATPEAILGAYLDHITPNLLITGQPGGVNGDFVPLVKDIKGSLYAHWDLSLGLMFISKQNFKMFCQRLGVTASSVLHALAGNRNGGQRLVVDTNRRKTLGTGTNYAALPTWCFVVNMEHPDIEKNKADIEARHQAAEAAAKETRKGMH